MNLGLTFIRTIPLITLMTGILLSTNIAKAASDATTDKASLKQEIVEDHKQTGGHPQSSATTDKASLKQEIVEDHKQTGEHPQSSAATDKASLKQEIVEDHKQTEEHPQSSAATGKTSLKQEIVEDHKQTGGHPQSSAATDKTSLKQEIVEDHKQTEEHPQNQTREHHQTGGIPQLLLSKKAQTIEFSIFLTTIFLSIFVPELFYNPIKNIQGPKSSESEKDNLQQEQIGKIELPLPPLKVVPEKTKTSNSVPDKSAKVTKINNQAKIKSETQSKQEQKAA
jgi:hypothetical protein